MLGVTLGVTVIGLLAVLLWVVIEQPRSLFGGEPEAAGSTSSTPVLTSSSTTTTVQDTTTSIVTTTRPAPTTTTRPTTTTTLPAIQLRPDGLRLVPLGTPTEEAAAAVSEVLGPPTSDTGWISSSSDLGTCPGSIVRVIAWDSLRLYFSDGPTEYGEGESHFFYYVNSSAEAEAEVEVGTGEGVMLGDPVARLEAAYGDRVHIDSSIAFGPTFVVDPAGPGILSGTLSLATSDGVVTSIAGGFGCGA